MPRINRLFGPAALLWPLWLGAQTQLTTQSQPGLAQILERLDKLERDNRALSEEVRSLRARLDSTADSKTQPTPDGETVPGAGTANAAAGAPATVEEKLDIQGKRIDEQAQTKVEASQRFPVRLTGMALFNAFLNSKQNGGVEYPAVVAAPGAGFAGATMRQTIIGLEFRGPSTVWGGNVHGSVYMDFAAGATNSAMRLRTGSIEIDWKNRNVMVGIEKPIFNPREPSSLAQLAVSPLTGSGNLWLWLPQARVEQDFSLARATGLRARLGVVETHETGPYAGTNFTGPVEAARPGLEGRFEFYHNLDDDRRLEIASGFHTSQTHVAGTSVASSLFSFDWFFNPWRRLEFTGAYYNGQNVTPLGAGYQQGYGIYGYGEHRQVEPVHSQGGWAQVTFRVAPRLDFHFFSGQQDDRNEDLNAGRIAKNLIFGGNLYYHLAPNVIVGLETTQLRTLYIGQGVRINNHYDLALGYLF
ncbi:MAG TPA: hypothetical protein VGZ73_26785 [Bryobacteraceae bacterium]|jgi:hypothetical protein|nr:hypothetical protein [Bryobacteraceae bacterium]